MTESGLTAEPQQPESGKPERSIDEWLDSLRKEVETHGPAPHFSAASPSQPQFQSQLPPQPQSQAQSRPSSQSVPRPSSPPASASLPTPSAVATPPAGSDRTSAVPTVAPVRTDDARKSAGGGRIFLRNLLFLAVAGAVVYGYSVYEKHTSAGSPAAPAPAGPHPSASGPVVALTAEQTFPKTVAGPNGTTYTLLEASPLHSCTNSDMIGTYLAGMIAQSGGCKGAVGGFYADGSKDEYTIVLFTLDNPTDVVTIETTLASNPTDYEVGTLVPPAGSGLAALPATSGLVQSFFSEGHVLGIGVAQWSDGRTTDYNRLETLLQPLTSGIMSQVEAAKS